MVCDGHLWGETQCPGIGAGESEERNYTWRGFKFFNHIAVAQASISSSPALLCVSAFS